MAVQLALALPAAATRTPSLGSRAAVVANPQNTIEALERQKLQQEIRSLRETNGEPWWQRQGTLGFLGAAIAGLGLFWTVVQQRREFARQRNADRDAGERAQEARVDALFARLAANLASDRIATRLAATAGIESFASEERRPFHGQLLSVLQGIIKVPHDDIGDRVLARAFLHFLSLQQARGALPPNPLDLEGACLAYCHLADLDLRHANLRGGSLEQAQIDADVALDQLDARDLRAPRLQAENVLMSGANLDGANLQTARFRRANLSSAKLRRANLVSADLRQCILRDARFNDSRLQGAHFEHSDLIGARFDGSDLRDAYFIGAQLDQEARLSISRAHHWQEAHFDPSDLALIEQGG